MSNQVELAKLQLQVSGLLRTQSQQSQHIYLLQRNYKDLEQAHSQLKLDFAALQTENEQLRRENEQLKAQGGPPPTKLRLTAPPRLPRSQRSQPAPAKRPAPEPEPLVPSEVQRVQYECCPDCGGQLGAAHFAWSHTVVDTPPPPPPTIIRYDFYKRNCGSCGTDHVPAANRHGQTLGQARFGPRLTALVGWLRTVARLPLQTIVDWLAAYYQISISPAAVVELLHRLAARSQHLAQAVHQQLVAGPVLHMDETSWRQNGQQGYIWMLCNAEGYRYYHYDRSRAQPVADKLLQGFTGVLVTDFYGGYNNYSGVQQRCWVHLLRDLHEEANKLRAVGVQLSAVAQQQPSVSNQQRAAQGWQRLGEFERWAAGLRRLYLVGQWLAEHEVGQAARERAKPWLEDKLRAVAEAARSKEHPGRRLVQRLRRHEGELFTYVVDQRVPADNNLGERSIRALAIARKISGGSRSAEGSSTRMVLQTVFGTWLARGENALQECLKLLGVTNSLPQT